VVNTGGGPLNPHFPGEAEPKDTYFIYFYWVINVGALFSYFVMAQVATEPQDFGLPLGWGFFGTFSMAAGSLALALTTFFSASSKYVGSNSVRLSFLSIAAKIVFSHVLCGARAPTPL